VFGSLLASIALAIAMIAVPAPKAEAQAVGSTGQIVDPAFQGGTWIESARPETPSNFEHYSGHLMKFSTGGTTYFAYCLEGREGPPETPGVTGKVVDWAQYGGVKNTSGSRNLLVGNDAETQQRREKINWILHNSYPYVDAADLASRLNLQKVHIGDMVTATQAAIHYYSDDLRFRDFRGTTKVVFDYLTGPQNGGQKYDSKSGIAGLPVENTSQDFIIVPNGNAPIPDPDESSDTPPTAGSGFAPQIRTQASFYKNETVQRVHGSSPEDRVWDVVQIDKIKPGYKYQLKTTLYRVPQSKPVEKKDTDDQEFDVPGSDFTITGKNPDGTVSGFITTHVDDGRKLLQGEYGYISQVLEVKGYERNGTKKSGWHEIARHDGSTDLNQRLHPHSQIYTVASFENIFTKGYPDSERVDYVAVSGPQKPPNTVFDKVYVDKISAGVTYTLQAELVRKGEGAPLTNNKGSLTFTADKLVDKSKKAPYSGWVVVPVPGAAQLKAGESAVVFEKLYANGNLVAEHADINDQSQTISVERGPAPENPYGEIRTSVSVNGVQSSAEKPVSVSAADVASGLQIKDSIEYLGLVAGMKYRFDGQLYRVDGDAPVAVEGAEKSETVIVGDGGRGVAEVDFGVVRDLVPGATYVVFERAVPVGENGEVTTDGQGQPVNPEIDNRVVIKHEDASDRAQTFVVEEAPAPANPEGKISTSVTVNDVASTPRKSVLVSAADAASGLHIKDSIRYSGLVAGMKYRFDGQVYRVDGDAPVAVEGAEKSETVIAGDGGRGVAEVDFGVVRDLVPGATYVVFERAVPVGENGEVTTDGQGQPVNPEIDNRVVIKHEDASDRAQTFFVKEEPATSTVTTTVPAGFKPNPAIKTRAEFKDGATQVIAGATVVDTVSYYGLVAGKNYTLDAKLVDKQDADRVLGTGAVTFTVPGKAGELVNGSVKVEIAVNENVTEPVQAAVAFERLTSTEVNAAGEKTNGKTNQIADHEEINDENQTVRTVFEPSIKTNAKFDTGSTEVVAGNKVIDTVEHKGLVPGKEYTLSAKLMKRLGEAGSYSAGGVLGEGTATFTPKTTDGFVEVTITVNDDVTTPVAAAVAFEELTSTVVNKTGQDNPQGGETPDVYSDDNKIAEHKDINDANQTVGVPHISTNANFANGATEVVNGSVVVDTVTYDGLVPNKEYTLTAQLIDKADGTTVLGTGTKTFTPTKPNGFEDVEITVTNVAEGRVVTAAVAFEELTSKVVDAGGNETPNNPGDNKIAEHKEINDDDQTVRNPRITTNANFANGAQEVTNGVAVIDTVTYEGLVPNKVYTLKADLINKADGKTVLGSATKTFIPETANGSEDVTIVVTNAPKGEKVYAAVAFEELTSTQVDRNGKDNPTGSKNPNEIAEHKKINDESQTVRSPYITTNAKFEDAKVVQNGTVVIDEVSYFGLVPNKKYTLTAELKERLGEAAPYREGRTIGTGTAEVTTTAENDKVEVRITVEGLNEGEQVAAAVAFEELTSIQVDRFGNETPNGGDNKIADHKDINDGNQTVEGPVTTPTPTTSEEPIPTTTIQLLPSTEPSTTGASATKTAGVEESSTTSEPTPTSVTETTPTSESPTTSTTSTPTTTKTTTVASTTVTVPAEPTTGESTTTTEPAPTTTEATITETTTSEPTPTSVTETTPNSEPSTTSTTSTPTTTKSTTTKTTTVASTTVTVPAEPTTGESTTTTEPAPTTTEATITETTTSEPTPTSVTETTPSSEPSTTSTSTTTKSTTTKTTTVASTTVTVPAEPTTGESTTTTEPAPTTTETTTSEPKPTSVTETTPTSESPTTSTSTTTKSTTTKTTTVASTTVTVPAEPTTDESTTTTESAPTTTEVTTTEVTTEATTEVTTPETEPSTSETAPSSTPVVPLVPSNPEGKIDTKVTVNGRTIVDGQPVTVTEQDVNNGLQVSDEITYSGLVAGTKYRFEGQLQLVEFNEAGEVANVTPVTEVKFTDVVAAETGAGVATVDFGTLTELTAGATYVVYEQAIPLDENDQPTTNPDGTPKDPSKDNRKVIEHKDPKDKAQTFVVEKTPTTSPTAPVAPTTTPDNCVPVTTVSTVPGTTVAESTVPDTTVPGTTNPGTPETPGTTVPGTTVPGTTVAESTVPVTTLPEHCVTTTPVTPTTEPTVPTAPTQPTEPTQPQPSVPVVPSTQPTTTTPVVPGLVWFPTPQIGTNADFAGGAKEVKSGTTIVDTVKYQGLVPGRTYTLSAELVSKDVYNGLADKNAYGEAVIGWGTATFESSATGTGTVLVEIPVIDGIDTPVRAAVAFETLTSTEVDRNGQENFAGGDTPGDISDDNQIAEHKNINDLNQTVRSPLVPGTPPVPELPYISTNANFADGSVETVAGAKVIDTVKYSGLVPGKTYTLTADLVAKQNQAVIGQGRKEFVADAAGFGSVDVEITVADWVKNPVYAAVAFETLTSTEVDAQGKPLEPGNRVPVTIAQHRDIEDASQTVITPGAENGIPLEDVPGVSTNADFAKGAQVTNGAVIRDVVKYWGLVPGKTYTATADLMERVGAKAPYEEGRKLGSGTVTFTPERAAGEVVVEIPVTGLKDGEVVAAAVAFETITSTEVDRNGNDNPTGVPTTIAEHRDINDDYQTVGSTENGVPPTTTAVPTTTEAPGDKTSSDSKLWWLLLIPGIGLIPALIGGGNGGSSQPAPKPTPAPSEPAPAPATTPAPKPQGNPVAPDSPRTVIQQVPSGGTARDAQMPAYI